MIKAIALDDEPPALAVIRSFCDKVDFISLEETFTKTEEAFKYLTGYDIDLLFLDINMPTISGIDFYKRLPKKTMVIFTTAYSEFAIEGFNLNAVDYLLKPFTFNRFLQGAEKARSFHKAAHSSATEDKEEFLTLRVNYGLTKIPFADIIYIEGLDDYLKIHLRQQKPIVARLTMKAILEKLPTAKFIRVHRSYIVGLADVESVRNKIVSIKGEEIPLGSTYEANFLSMFNS